jgi:hypothetical protein
MVICNLSKCGSAFKDRKCKCYVSQDAMNLKGITADEKIQRMNANQFCGFESDDGFVYACDPGCCKTPCPGQCDGVAPRPPEGVYTTTAGNNPADAPKTRPFLEIILLIVLALSLISTLALLA